MLFRPRIILFKQILNVLITYGIKLECSNCFANIGCSDTVQIEDYSFKEITSSTPVPIDETTEIIIESQPKEKSYPKYQASEDSSVYLERYQEKWMVRLIPVFYGIVIIPLTFIFPH